MSTSPHAPFPAAVRAPLRAGITAVVAAILAIVALPPLAAASPGPVAVDRDPGSVRVSSGWLQGSVADDHVRFSGVPYAAPPVGDRRWTAPARVRPWRGVRDATRPSPLCPQAAGPDTVRGQEDCLYLDVTVPRGEQSRRGHRERLPVLVWLHGGGLTSGGAQQYDGARLAVQGDLVVVTVNYRLGALGWLSSRELDRGGGNYGLMDQTAALRWVRRNAARFGGDPRNVTLAGQSAGARSVCAHLAAPRSRRLFDRAIVQSGACDNAVLSRKQARRFGELAIDELGCASAAEVGDCLRSRSPERLVRTLDDVGQGLTATVTDRPWGPVAGTRTLPRQPGDALRRGRAARVPLLVGGTRDEMQGIVAGQAGAITSAEYRALVSAAFGDRAPEVLARYPVHAYDSPALALSAVLGDWGGRIGSCPVLRTAESAAPHQPVYAYEFAEDSGQEYAGLPLGAYHGLDLPYSWDLKNGYFPYPPLDADQQRLSATLIGYWAAFVRTGDPNGGGRPGWPSYDDTGAVVGISTDAIAPAPVAADHQCAFWADQPH